jgi:hypothetical protein
VSSTGGSSSTGSPCAAGPDEDLDNDGYSIAAGDCNDCDPFVSPAAAELVDPMNPGDPDVPKDDDCDGEIDEIEPPCDAGLALDALDAPSAAKAIGLCRFVPESPWGVVSAKWVRADGFPAPTSPAAQVAAYHGGHGLVPSFGSVSPLEGERLLALSTGTARVPGRAGYVAPSPGQEKGITGAIVQTIPSPTCPGLIDSLVVYDDIALEVELLAPSNVKAFSFAFDFFTAGWPYDVCTKYDDFFLALADIPFQPSFVNVAHDALGNPVTLNAAFLDACGCSSGPPCLAPPSNPKKSYSCGLGTGPLIGTGFDGSAMWSFGGTDWLVTGATLVPGKKLTVRFAIGEGGDGLRDSTVLLDRWEWTNQQPVPHTPPP